MPYKRSKESWSILLLAFPQNNCTCPVLPSCDWPFLASIFCLALWPLGKPLLVGTTRRATVVVSLSFPPAGIGLPATSSNRLPVLSHVSPPRTLWGQDTENLPIRQLLGVSVQCLAGMQTCVKICLRSGCWAWKLRYRHQTPDAFQTVTCRCTLRPRDCYMKLAELKGYNRVGLAVALRGPLCAPKENPDRTGLVPLACLQDLGTPVHYHP